MSDPKEITAEVDLRAPVTRAEYLALERRFKKLEEVVHKEHRPELDEHDDRLDKHDLEFEALERLVVANVTQLASTMAAVLVPVQQKVDALTAASNEQNKTFATLNATLMRIILAIEGKTP